MPEPESPKRRNLLLYLAAEGVVPVLAGCAGALAGGPVAGVAGVAVGHAVEKAINLFGRGIVERWQRWFARNPEEAPAAVAELAALPPAEAHKEARSIILELAPDAATPDIELAVEFLSAIPKAVDRALIPNPTGEGRSLPPTVTFDDPRSLLQLLPEDIPPYRAAAELPGTPYRLVELLGSGGFGAVYRAVSPTLQHLPLAIKFCLDRSLLPALNQERSNLERLMRAGGPGARHVVRLYGYDLDHATPYLVYEYVEGGDLTRLVASRRSATGRPADPGEVLGWVVQIAEGLAFAHRAGLVHRDLKPANVLADGDTLKLADFGLGGVAAARAAVRSRIGTTTLDYLSLADQASLFRGAGTPLYMSPEQRRGAPPDPRHDLYALGVVWFQLLTGDVSRELHHGWAKELAVRFGVPAAHVGLIERCVGWYDDRPKDAGELLPLLQEAAGSASPGREPGEGSHTDLVRVACPQCGDELEVPEQLLGRELLCFRCKRPFTPERRPAKSPPVAPAPSPAAANTVTGAGQVTPAPQPASGMRRTLLGSLVAKLGAAHAELARWQGWPTGRTVFWGFWIGLLVGWPAGEWAYSQRNPYPGFPMAFSPRGVLDWGANLFGVGVGLGVWAGYVFLTLSLVRAATGPARRRVAEQVDEIAAEFPIEVAEWGGRAVLRHPPTVRRIRDELTRPAAASSTSGLTPDDIAADPTRKGVLVARLREHAQLLNDTKTNTDATWVGLVFLWMFATPGVGGACSAIPYLFAGGGNDPGVKSTMVVFGVAGGLLAAVLSWWGMAAIRRSLARKQEAGITRFAADYPKLVESWGGRGVLESQESVVAVVKTLDPTAVQVPGFFRRLFGG